jgi:hypothetical protein
MKTPILIVRHKLIRPHGRHSGLGPESGDFFASANPPDSGKVTSLDTGFRRDDKLHGF